MHSVLNINLQCKVGYPAFDSRRCRKGVLFLSQMIYHKIRKISPGAYIFQRPFLRGLSTEGNLRFKNDWVSLIVGSIINNLPFLLCFTLYLRAILRVEAPGEHIFGGAI